MNPLEFSRCPETVIWAQQDFCSYRKNESLLKMNKYVRLLSFHKVTNMLIAAQEQFWKKNTACVPEGCGEPRDNLPAFHQPFAEVPTSLHYHRGSFFTTKKRRKGSVILREKTEAVHCLHKWSKVIMRFRNTSPSQSHYLGSFQKAHHKHYIKQLAFRKNTKFRVQLGSIKIG